MSIWPTAENIHYQFFVVKKSIQRHEVRNFYYIIWQFMNLYKMYITQTVFCLSLRLNPKIELDTPYNMHPSQTSLVYTICVYYLFVFVCLPFFVTFTRLQINSYFLRVKFERVILYKCPAV